ncbi:nitroreductase family protein [Sporomusa sphaeroides]|uniref:5,6-dimethylbenzimidazole synthase n=2 Tax=Sporomusa TaxID=2375 RepID=A0ABM9W3Z8_9FIRM|nr:nitroreductase family protein [Sporomusa sphaeroides]OLS58609.1 5,6-dimethylbenzimidazole synthase [Sporomusa sphaeroides DSM 2875]CVK19881.1 5,6-dimethylbenzimidazole synthase [Sporomusa sphaeroides DSM 2875]SCM80021.1 putative NADH dehydrogenase/NAD(P)H nitroreductase AF_0226 [uncultured Sporomusa sp.]
MTKDIFDCIRQSHSIRNFRSEQIPDATLTRILEAGNMAPSAGNLQPWYFYVVQDVSVKEKIAAAAFDQEQINEAPTVIVITADPARSNELYGERGAQLYCIQDTAAAAQNILLAAEGLGVAACWVGAFNETKVEEAIKAPPRLRAVAIICLGYSNEQPKEYKERLRLAEVAKFIH